MRMGRLTLVDNNRSHNVLRRTPTIKMLLDNITSAGLAYAQIPGKIQVSQGSSACRYGRFLSRYDCCVGGLWIAHERS